MCADPTCVTEREAAEREAAAEANGRAAERERWTVERLAAAVSEVLFYPVVGKKVLLTYWETAGAILAAMEDPE